MLERDVVLSKISTIKRCVDRITRVTKLDPETLSKIDIEDIFVLNLQRAIQATIDIANLIIAQNKYQMPNSYKMTFAVLAEHDWIDPDTCRLMQKRVGFRNLAIHDYQDLDAEILKSILVKNLSDFERFSEQVTEKLDAG